VRTVVITAFYNQYLDGRVPIAANGRPGVDPAGTFRRAAGDTGHELVASGKRVVLVSDVPEFVEPCLPPRPHFFRSQASCTIAADAEATASAASRSVLDNLAEGARVFLFDARSAFCRDGRCMAKSGRTYLYNADGNHLTAAGIDVLIESLRQSAAWAAIGPFVVVDPS